MGQTEVVHALGIELNVGAGHNDDADLSIQH
jgi:hypothetical protein